MKNIIRFKKYSFKLIGNSLQQKDYVCTLKLLVIVFFMDPKNSKLDKIINILCEGKDEDYKIFMHKMIYAMSDGDKWEKLSKLKDLADQLKK